MKRSGLWFCVLLSLPSAAEKRESVFYPRAAIERARANARQHEWAAHIQKRAIQDADRWRRMSDEELWDLVFGATITRSHMVWSSGYCPACRKRVPMYDWKIDAWAQPWKVRCPHCDELFPKNDFEKFYRSGLDASGVFDPRRADRALLFNTEHPDPADPLHRFGVDDGEGYVEPDKRWRFIGAYLLYGQWSQKIEPGVRNLATAYTVTGDRAYAHKAAVLLDRIADLWPTFDYATQGVVYERARYGGGVAGYVYYAITSAFNVKELVSAYDKVFDGMDGDDALVDFLRGRDPRKTGVADIRRNIETRILRHALDNPAKIRTNYPGSERTLSSIRTVLDWPANRPSLLVELDEVVRNSTEVDGLSGEKGLNSYAAIAPRLLAEMLEEYARLDPRLLAELLERNPKLKQTWRFHVDTWIGKQYYPLSGDAGSFSRRSTHYPAIAFAADSGAAAVSPYTFLHRMWKLTGDSLYPQLAWHGNGERAEGLPHDIFAEDPSRIAADIRSVVERAGPWPAVGSVNKSEWKIAILRHPSAPDAAVWLDYDSVPEGRLKNHYHFDAMNLGLYAKGLDLLPEFGYPAVQFGDWHTPQALWHKKTAAHNTVMVDGKDQAGGAAEVTFWRAGGPFQAIRVSSPSQIKGSAYERTVAMIQTGPTDFYVFDVFRVSGGRDHAKFTRPTFATGHPFGVKLLSGEPHPRELLMRNFQMAARPEPAWGVDWKIEDRYGYGNPGVDIHLRYTDLTRGVEAWTAESWTVASMTSTVEYWIPTVIARRRAAESDLTSTFVSLLDPYESEPQLKRITRLDREGEDAVRVEVVLNDGRRDLLVASPRGVTWERRDAVGEVGNGGQPAAGWQSVNATPQLFSQRSRKPYARASLSGGKPCPPLK